MKIKVRQNSKPEDLPKAMKMEQPRPPTFTPNEPRARLEPEVPTNLPPPPHIGQPVGSPPPPAQVPDTFEGLTALARKVSGSPPPHSDKALIFAQIATALATNRLANLLEELVVFSGARDGDIADQKVKLIDVLQSGLIEGVLGLKEELVPDGGNIGEMLRADMSAYVASTAQKEQGK